MTDRHGGDKQPALRIAQITDTHLFADPAGKLLGLQTRRSLDAVTELVRRTGKPDLVVASGDLSHDGSADAYRQLRDCFSHIGAPTYCLPGNHDEASALHRHMNSGNFFHVRNHCAGGWQQVFIDSTVAGSEGGHLADSELLALDQALADHPTLPALVWLHHQPVEVGSRWLDTMAVDNPDAFFSVIDRHPQVRAILWGHVHQIFEQRRNDVLLMSTPSTCIQFLAGSAEFAIDRVPPGYRWLELFADGSLQTGVERLARIPGTIDPGARGY